MHYVTDKIPARAGPVDRSDPENHPNLCNLAGSNLLEKQAFINLKESGKCFCYIVSSLHHSEALFFFKFHLI